jgi:hypothetical protein
MENFKIGDVVCLPPNYQVQGKIKAIFPHTGRALVKVMVYYHLISLNELKPYTDHTHMIQIF